MAPWRKKVKDERAKYAGSSAYVPSTDVFPAVSAGGAPDASGDSNWESSPDAPRENAADAPFNAFSGYFPDTPPDTSAYSRDHYGTGGAKRAGYSAKSSGHSNLDAYRASIDHSADTAQHQSAFASEAGVAGAVGNSHLGVVDAASAMGSSHSSYAGAAGAMGGAYAGKSNGAATTNAPNPDAIGSTSVMPDLQHQASDAGAHMPAAAVVAVAAASGDQHAASHESDAPEHAVNAGGNPPLDLTSAEVYTEISRVRKRRRTIKRVLIGVGCFILALVLAGGAYALWFMNSLDSALAPDKETMSKLDEVLVPAASGEPFYLLLLGSDSREGSWSWTHAERGDNERADVIILTRVDPRNKKLTLLSIPRDTPHKKADGTYEKINETYNTDGASGTVKAVADLTGANISHYAEVHISGLEAVVDLLGGVEVDVPIELSYKTTDNVPITIEPGKQTLNGQEAQIFARARHEYESEQDVHRQDAVRQLLIAIINKTLNRPVTQIPDVVLKEASYIDTDIRSGDIVGRANAFSGGGSMTVYTGTGPTDGDINPLADDQWRCFLNPEGWKKIMGVVGEGKNPKGVDVNKTAITWEEVAAETGQKPKSQLSESSESSENASASAEDESSGEEDE